MLKTIECFACIFSTLLDQPVAYQIIIHNLRNVIGQVCVVYRLYESIIDATKAKSYLSLYISLEFYITYLHILLNQTNDDNNDGIQNHTQNENPDFIQKKAK